MVDVATGMSEADAQRILAEYFHDNLTSGVSAPDVTTWANASYYIPETGRQIRLMPHQRVMLDMALDPANDFTTIVYSTIKKSGKTAVGGLVGRYIAEFSGPKSEVYFIANDKDQAKDRAYESAKTSIELTPGYDRGKRVLPGQWRVIEKQCVHERSGSIMRAIASDYEGAAGGNPNATLWTELWAFSSERFKRLWDELTPVPTRARSIRFVETYAGYTDESELLLDLYKMGMQGKRLTHDDIDWPYPDQPPVWVNKNARMFMYWDDGVAARRMPWQIGPRGEAYYREQAATLRKEAFDRLHLNLWTSSVQSFLPVEWWKRCAWGLQEPEENPFPSIDNRTPIVLGVDGSVSGDCTAVVGVARDPRNPDTDVMVCLSRVWFPPKGGTIDYADVKAHIKLLCDQFNIVQIAYDPYQMHSTMQEIMREAIAWVRAFSQASDREKADKQLYDLIRDRKIVHNDQFESRFIENCAAHVVGAMAGQNKIERLRIVKKAKDAPVDPVVACSMATSECLRLIL